MCYNHRRGKPQKDWSSWPRWIPRCSSYEIQGKPIYAIRKILKCTSALPKPQMEYVGLLRFAALHPQQLGDSDTVPPRNPKEPKILIGAKNAQ